MDQKIKQSLVQLTDSLDRQNSTDYFEFRFISRLTRTRESHFMNPQRQEKNGWKNWELKTLTINWFCLQREQTATLSNWEVKN